MASKTKRQKSSDSYRVMYGTCPDEGCQAKLYFPSYDKSIECTSCGQRHERGTLKNVAEVTNPEVALHNLLKNILLGNVKPKKGAENVKVLGLSNYVCKLISPILTFYGMDKETGKAKLLSDMGKGEVFDVSILGDRAFLIEEENLDVIGYGRDRSGSRLYLKDTLKDIQSFNDNEERIVPIHADGDGHCLVHAISRALVGRELFWHALRVNLSIHMRQNLEKYKRLFHDFVDKDEWEAIIEECDPCYIPPWGESHGLRNIHIFGLANVLHRPIILLDSKGGMSSSGDYAGVFLPGFVPPEQCRGKDGSLNKPLCVAWSSSGHNHYIPLVAVKDKGPALLPSYMVQKSWGMPKEEIKKYIEFDKLYRCQIGGDKCLTEKYMRHLVSSMEEVFEAKHQVSPDLVADVHQYIYKSAGYVGVLPEEVIARTQNSIRDKILYRCLMCEALVEYILTKEEFEKGGALYNLALSIYKKLDPTKYYSFPMQGAVCTYDAEKDCLVPDLERSNPKSCAFCNGEMLRQVRADGSIVYKDLDRTTTPCVGGKCPCGFKHYWQGKEYDNLPQIFPIELHWAGKTVTEKIAWFQYESDPTLNSNVFEVAQSVVQKHFPGEFGSERLVQRVVDSILAQSARADREEKQEQEGEGKEEPMTFGDGSDPWSAETASKIILTGQKKKTLHKEELMKSEKEKQVRKNIQTKAPLTQHKKTSELEAAKAAQAKAKTEAAKPKTSAHTQSSSQPVAGPSSMSQSTAVPPVAGEKKVRLQTSDGRQEMLTLVKDVTYSELQNLIYESVGVPVDRQKIRVGFPPKLLEAPVDGEEEKVVPLHHGDKIALEILPDLSYPVEETAPHTSSKMTSSWSSFEEDVPTQTAEKLLQALKEAQHGGDNIDTSIASLGILAAVQGKDLWSYVQSTPHLFSVGGLLYNQVKRDLGLVDGKHCQLSALPGKVFRYNAAEDRLELCLEPYGHFPVEPNIEQKVKEKGMEGSKETQEVKFGASGAVHHGTERPAFLGHGHSLKSTMNFDERMPADLMPNNRPSARGIRDLCSPPGSRSRSESITEEPEEMQVEEPPSQEEDSKKEQTHYHRIGPGYSVIDHSAANSNNANLEMFRALAEHIEKTLADVQEDAEGEATAIEEETEAEMEAEYAAEKPVETGMVVEKDEEQFCKRFQSDISKRTVSEIDDSGTVKVAAESFGSVPVHCSQGQITSLDSASVVVCSEISGQESEIGTELKTVSAKDAVELKVADRIEIQENVESNQLKAESFSEDSAVLSSDEQTGSAIGGQTEDLEASERYPHEGSKCDTSDFTQVDATVLAETVEGKEEEVNKTDKGKTMKEEMDVDS